MRKVLGLFVAVGLLAPLGVMAASPAGSAASKPTCKTATGTVSYKPAIPAGSKTKVNTTSTTTLHVGGCTGGGVTGALSVSSQKLTGQNCVVFLSDKKTKTSTGTIKWTPTGTSTASTTLKVVKLAATGIIVTATQKILTGLFKGDTTTTTISANLNKNACGSAALSLITFKNTTPLVTK